MKKPKKKETKKPKSFDYANKVEEIHAAHTRKRLTQLKSKKQPANSGLLGVPSLRKHV